MTKRWRQLELRFAGLKRRERGVLIAGGVSLVLLLGFSLFDSSSARQRLLVENIDQLRAETAKAKGQSATIVDQLAEDADGQAQSRIAQLSRETHDIDEQLQNLNANLVPPERMVGILQDILSLDQGVKLVKLRTLPVSRLREGKLADHVANVYKHGIEISLQGQYRDVLSNLDRLEKLPWRMFWSDIRMDARNYPAVQITVTVFTLSLDDDWLVV